MTREETAEFMASERDAQLWRYFQCQDWRRGRIDDPDLVIAKRVNGRLEEITPEDARHLLEGNFEVDSETGKVTFVPGFFGHAIPV